MNQRQLGIISIAVVAIVALVAVFWYVKHPSRQLRTASQAPVAGNLQPGQTAPEFAAATTGGLFDLNKIGKPAFIEIFATWCPHCQRETAVIDKLYAKYGSRVAFVGVSGSGTAMDNTSAESQADVLAWAQRFHAQYPVAYDPVPSTATDGVPPIARLYLQGGFPTIVIVGRDKKIAYVNSGEISYDELAAAIEKALR